MAISYDEQRGIFCLATEHTSYFIGIADGKYVGHAYYGARMEDCGCGYLMRTGEKPLPPSENIWEKASFADSFPFEYSTAGVGDYRNNCLACARCGGAGPASWLMRAIGFSRASRSCRACRPPLPVRAGRPRRWRLCAGTSASG